MKKISEILTSDKIILLIRTANSNSYVELITELSLEQKCMFYTKALRSLEEAVSNNIYINILLQRTLKGFRAKLEESLLP